MNEETLERMITDRALGCLSRDVTALLDAYLDKEPGAAAHALEMEQTVALARQALQPRIAPSLPPLKVRPLAMRPTAAIGRRRMVQGIGWAAAFLLGATLSAVMLRPNLPTPIEPKKVALIRQPEPVPSVIWSAVRRTNPSATDSATEGPRLIWTSPLKRPLFNN